ncbi:MAG: chemotaxis-specific protein-glutamate methyltransferase CheB [Spirochaetales bacterium]|nr:chemotaxis-specific protein-glutamate methyltransferase CheB [Spirochaetales bacterium]
MIKILIVDDSALIRSILKQVFSDTDDIVIAGEASNGKSGVEAVRALKPDLVILDINMPVMDGIESTRIIMAENPCPILILSSMIDADTSFRACQAGAMDVMAKPDISQYNDPVFLKNFFTKIRLLGSKSALKEKSSRLRTDVLRPEEIEKTNIPEMIVIGASTGGPKAVRTILSGLPGDLPIPIALVQHLESGFAEGYRDWLNGATDLDVVLVNARMKCTGGKVFLAPTDRHIVVDRSGVYPDDGAKVLNQKPAVDVLFNSASSVFGSKLLGVLLTGMGSDGAMGCLSIVKAGGTTLVQDEASSVIYGMPKEAAMMGAASFVVPLDEMAGSILRILKNR